MKRTTIAGVALVAILVLVLSLGAFRHAARADVDSSVAISCLFVAEVIDGERLDFVTGNDVFAACDNLTPSEIATIASAGGETAAACDGLSSTEVENIAQAVGDLDGTLEPSDLTGYDLDGNQVTDAAQASTPILSRIYVIAFVDDDGGVLFDAGAGVSVSINDDGGANEALPADDANPETCDGDDDADCGASTLDNGDGVVVATITETSARPGDSVDVDVIQGGVGGTETLDVVGAPADVQVQVVELTIQSGASAGCANGSVKVTDPDALANHTSTIATAVVTDGDSRPLTRIVTSLSSNDPGVAVTGDTTVLTIDAGGSGIAAFAVICGIAPGATFITANTGALIDSIPVTVVSELSCESSPELCPTTTITPPIGCDPTSPPCPTATATPDPNASSPPLCEWPLSPPNCGPDADSDGVPDDAEFWYGTDPNDPDTDDDGFLDRPQLLHLALNTDTLRDNCPNVFNPPQVNGDGNLINLHPAKAFDDVTLAFSDAAGDECDGDVDNDGLPNDDEVFGDPCSGAIALTKASDPDSDDDLVLDYAECILGTDPNNINSVPPFASCASTADNDGDRVSDLREFCYYNTSTSSSDSDNDGCTDAAELASINGDTKVNSLDLTQVAQNFALSTYAIPAAPHTVQFDINRDRKINAIDLSQIAQNFNAQSCM